MSLTTQLRLAVNASVNIIGIVSDQDILLSLHTCEHTHLCESCTSRIAADMLANIEFHPRLVKGDPALWEQALPARDLPRYASEDLSMYPCDEKDILHYCAAAMFPPHIRYSMIENQFRTDLTAVNTIIGPIHGPRTCWLALLANGVCQDDLDHIAKDYEIDVDAVLRKEVA